MVKKEKCIFLGESVEYLGHRVDKHGLHTVPEKMRAIVEAPHPKTVQELISFLGLKLLQVQPQLGIINSPIK